MGAADEACSLRSPDRCGMIPVRNRRDLSMKLILVISFLVGLTAVGHCQTAAEPKPALGEVMRLEAFQVHKRADSYGIASFAISNGTDKPVSSIELMCWLDDDRAHGTKVLIWPSPGAIPAHGSQQFSNVNIGLTGDARSTCEVAGAE